MRGQVSTTRPARAVTPPRGLHPANRWFARSPIRSLGEPSVRWVKARPGDVGTGRRRSSIQKREELFFRDPACVIGFAEGDVGEVSLLFLEGEDAFFDGVL